MAYQGKTHFFAIAAKQMRRILVQSARVRGAQKRGGHLMRVTLDDRAAFFPGTAMDILALNEAMERLFELSPRQGEVVELRFFAGLSVDETATLLGLSSKTVQRAWWTARAWLRKEVRTSLGP